MKVAIGCDEAAYALKESIKRHLRATHPELELVDFGTHSADEAVLYPDIAIEVAQRVAAGEFPRAILLVRHGHRRGDLREQGAGHPRRPVP